MTQINVKKEYCLYCCDVELGFGGECPECGYIKDDICPECGESGFANYGCCDICGFDPDIDIKPFDPYEEERDRWRRNHC